MKKLFLILFASLFVACSTVSAGSKTSDDATVLDKVEQAQETVVELPNLGPAPELQNEIWLNTSEPLRLANLRGKVVLLDMWTFG